MNDRFAGRTAIITGAGRGIGLAVGLGPGIRGDDGGFTLGGGA
ncbi:hypothetical protein ACFQ6B_31190 [Streptomyces wedmorensis]|uniref:Uncharacterized protein n=1 Tax=Streptomyces wedmorensis TaxID=43759 RepID=A0ABW6IYC2_STRWE